MHWEEISPLVVRAQAGDQEAFGELVGRFSAAVFARAVERLRDEADAQELTQDVFIHAYRKLGQLRDPRGFAKWLMVLAVRLAINRAKRRRRHAGGELLPETLAAPRAEPLDEMARAESRVGVRAAMAALKASDRALLEAFYLRHASLKDVAVELDVPVGTVKRRLFCARQRLKAVLEGNDAPKPRQRALVGV